MTSPAVQTVGTESRGALVAAERVDFSYGQTVALDSVDLAVGAGEKVALMGPSGSGKSTLLHCLAGILVPASGRVAVGGREITGLAERERARLRLAQLGVVFQFGDLVSELTLVENVMLPLELLGQRRADARGRAMEVLEQLGVAAVADRRAGEVSGGQAQRAAVARSLVHRPALLLADEPTGSLDTVSADAVMSALTGAASDLGAALLVVTHDHRVAAHLDRHVTMRDGRVVPDPTVMR